MIDFDVVRATFNDFRVEAPNVFIYLLSFDKRTEGKVNIFGPTITTSRYNAVPVSVPTLDESKHAYGIIDRSIVPTKYTLKQIYLAVNYLDAGPEMWLLRSLPKQVQSTWNLLTDESTGIEKRFLSATKEFYLEIEAIDAESSSFVLRKQLQASSNLWLKLDAINNLINSLI